MTDLQEQVKDICRLADAVIKDPSTGIASTATNIGVCAAIAKFAAGSNLICAPMPMSDDIDPWIFLLIAGTGLFFAPVSGLLSTLIAVVVLVIMWIAKKLREKEKQRQEKERMLREVIRKQQAVIKKLDQELAKSREQNAKNHQEIENLKEILRMLEEIERHLNVA